MKKVECFEIFIHFIYNLIILNSLYEYESIKFWFKKIDSFGAEYFLLLLLKKLVSFNKIVVKFIIEIQISDLILLLPVTWTRN